MKAETGANSIRKKFAHDSFEIRDPGSRSARTRVTDIDANARASVKSRPRREGSRRDSRATAGPQHSYM
jgi:hypothetical protein